MPELPEVEACRTQLQRWGEGRHIQRLELPDPAILRRRLSSRPSDAVGDPARAIAAVAGVRVGRPRRHGKRLAWPLGDGGWLLHLGMTGRWWRRPLDAAPPRHARLGMVLEDAVLWFVDSRRFGCVHPADSAAALATALRDGLGPDALVAPPPLATRLRGRGPVKVALMDQQVIAGVGNIHAVEALWRAALDPRIPCDALRPEDLTALDQALAAQLEAAIEGLRRGGDRLRLRCGRAPPVPGVRARGRALPGDLPGRAEDRALVDFLPSLALLADHPDDVLDEHHRSVDEQPEVDGASRGS